MSLRLTPQVHMPARVRFRNVCFTTYACDAPPTFNESKMSYLIYGLETCPTTNRRHYQGYVEFKSQIDKSKVLECFPGAHIERRNGSSTAAAEYCRKEGAFVEHGIISSQGSRSDLHTVAERISTGAATIADIAVESPGLLVQYHRGLQTLESVALANRQNEFRHVDVDIIWGRTGTGKTRSWFERVQYGGYRFQYGANGAIWWDGYNGQQSILFDEFSCQIPLSTMLMYLDGYPCRLPVKGAHTYAAWKNVTIISNEDPQSWYRNVVPCKRNAFARRIGCVTYIGDKVKIIRHSFAFEERPLEFALPLNELA